MPLTTYEEVRPWARAIKDQVLARREPRWHAARGYGAFKNDPTLTPIELAMLVSWIDGGLPFSTSSPRVPSGVPGRRADNLVATPPVASAISTPPVASGITTPPVASAITTPPVASAFRRKIGVPALRIPAGAAEATGRVRGRWISGWSFEPGDPLITSATFSLADETVVGNWVAGDPAVTLPSNSGIRISSPLRVRIERRAPADFEQPYKPRASVLRLAFRAKAPLRRVWTEQVSCNAPRTGRAAELLAVRPMLDGGGAARVWLERAGAPKTVVGWFRDFDARFPLTYWLARPADLPVDARLHADASCNLQLTVISLR